MIYLSALAVLSIIGLVLSVLLMIAHRFLAYYGECSITINDEKPFEIEGGGKLLDALYQKKIFIPSACGGQGTCGFCKVNVYDGGGPFLPTELPYLTKEEIKDEVRLACQIKVKEDIKLTIKPEFLKIKEFIGTVTSAKMVTHDTRELIIKLKEPGTIDFNAGQYVQVNIPNKNETTFRAYSVSSAPDRKNEIELLIRLIPGGLGSTYLHKVAENEELTFTGPYGDYVMDEKAEIICVGGGCGMAPMRSLIGYLHKVAPETKCSLFFGARTEKDLMYQEELEKLKKDMKNFSCYFALSEPGRKLGWKGETGFIHEIVDKYIKEGKDVNREAFLCGPPLMIKAVKKVLKKKGLPRKRVFFDEF